MDNINGVWKKQIKRKISVEGNEKLFERFICMVSTVTYDLDCKKSSFQIAKSLISLRALGVGNRTFPVAAAHVWNIRPQHVTSAQSLPVFHSRLKTHLFRRCSP